MEMTRVHSLKDMVDKSWSVWRVSTKSGSTYHVGLHEAGGKRLGIIRRAAKAGEPQLEVHDREPRLDNGKLLFEVPAPGWVGHCLDLGTVNTSCIVRVAPETDDHVVTAVTGVGLALPTRAAPPPPARPPYPMDCIEDIEFAAYLLRTLYRRQCLPEDLAKMPSERERMAIALTECALLIQGLGKKIHEAT